MFNSLQGRIQDFLSTHNRGPLKIVGADPTQWSFILSHLKLSGHLKNQIFLCPSVEKSEALYEFLKECYLEDERIVLNFPGLEVSPYGGVLSSEHALYQRFYALSQLAETTESSPSISLVCTYESFFLRTPSPLFFEKNSLKIEVSDVVSPQELTKKLFAIGYSSATTVEEAGTFSLKGEILDIYPVNHPPIRLHYFDDMIEEIFLIDQSNQRTRKDSPLEHLRIPPSPQIFKGPEFSSTLRSNLPMPERTFKNRLEFRNYIFSLLSSQNLFEGYASFCPLFLKDSSSLINFFNRAETSLFIFNEYDFSRNKLDFFELLNQDYHKDLQNIESRNLLPAHSSLYESYEFEDLDAPIFYVNELDLASGLDGDINDYISLPLEQSNLYLKKKIGSHLNKHSFLEKTFELISEEFKDSGNIIFTYSSQTSLNEINSWVERSHFSSDLKKRVHFENMRISAGFLHEIEKVLVLSDADLFSLKKKKAKGYKHQNIDLFAEQLATLQENDFVIHSEHGLGRYMGLQNIEIAGLSNDYLIIEYKSNDRVYVPVYNMNLIQKQADSSANLNVENLRKSKFHTLKIKARESAKKLAFDLLKLQAKRQSTPAFSFSPPDHEFSEFELAFPFEETPDQEKAIAHVIETMQKPIPMDHLVCGDVGFGKTEVAMRAAYKAVLDKKQVAVLVPTTVLSLQHFGSFQKRFKEFPVNVEFLSRFKSAKESKEIIQKLAEGKIDIIIGTHKLLSEKIKYQDLGLVIIDEEQRFGVGHKEKLKLIKSTVDFLTLTATPIPRTLQLAFLGIRDLSLIQTAPPKRQSIKTYLLKEDDHTIQSAINKELSRGGQVFIVHNRIQDIEQYTAYIQELVPAAKVVFAHGQLPEKELESRMKMFYQGEYQVLIATTIIESGIDIPNANTIIVDRADTFGLSQLHQLRGRIGRSDRKAYAYFIIPGEKPLTKVAEKRLKALQTYADMGSGFQIASSDLEIRGAGDILGGSQSGHIEQVGLELYMELLKDAISEIKGEERVLNRDLEIKAPFPSHIPKEYVANSSERLKYYKRLSNCESLEEIDNIYFELEDAYGPLPAELRNLIEILKARTYYIGLSVKSVHLASNVCIIALDKKHLDTAPELRDDIISRLIKFPNKYRFSPDYKITYHHKCDFTPSELLHFSKEFSGILKKT